MSDYNIDFIPQGWQCPICKRVYSPNTSMCLYCGNEKFSVASSTGEAVMDWVRRSYNTFPEEYGYSRTRINDYTDMVKNGWTPFGLEKENEDEVN